MRAPDALQAGRSGRLLLPGLSGEITQGLAPRAVTSLTFPRMLKLTCSCVARAMTGVPSSINAIVPCFNSPPAKPSANVRNLFQLQGSFEADEIVEAAADEKCIACYGQVFTGDHFHFVFWSQRASIAFPIMPSSLTRSKPSSLPRLSAVTAAKIARTAICAVYALLTLPRFQGRHSVKRIVRFTGKRGSRYVGQCQRFVSELFTCTRTARLSAVSPL